MKTSKELSEKLKKAGFEKESDNIHFSCLPNGNKIYNFGDLEKKKYIENEIKNGNTFYEEIIPAYDILNDLCCKYREEVWGKDTDRYFHSMRHHTNTILKFIQTNKPQKAIEDYLVANSILFK